MGQVGIPTTFWYSRGRIQTTRSRFLRSWQGGDGGGGLTDRREVGSAEGRGRRRVGRRMRVAIVISGEFRVCKTLPEVGPTVRKTEKSTVRKTSTVHGPFATLQQLLETT